MTAKCPLCFLSDDEVRTLYTRLTECATYWTCYDCAKRPVFDDIRTAESQRLVETVKHIHEQEMRQWDAAVSSIPKTRKWKVFG